MRQYLDFFKNKRNILFIVDQTNALVEEKNGEMSDSPTIGRKMCVSG